MFSAKMAAHDSGGGGIFGSEILVKRVFGVVKNRGYLGFCVFNLGWLIWTKHKNKTHNTKKKHINIMHNTKTKLTMQTNPQHKNKSRNTKGYLLRLGYVRYTK